MRPLELPAPDNAILDRDDCIVAEGDMAAFLDDVLASEYHQRLFDHLMECHLCLQTLLECMSDEYRDEHASVSGSHAHAAGRRHLAFEEQSSIGTVRYAREPPDDLG